VFAAIVVAVLLAIKLEPTVCEVALTVPVVKTPVTLAVNGTAVVLENVNDVAVIIAFTVLLLVIKCAVALIMLLAPALTVPVVKTPVTFAVNGAAVVLEKVNDVAVIIAFTVLLLVIKCAVALIMLLAPTFTVLPTLILVALTLANNTAGVTENVVALVLTLPTSRTRSVLAYVFATGNSVIFLGPLDIIIYSLLYIKRQVILDHPQNHQRLNS